MKRLPSKTDRKEGHVAAALVGLALSFTLLFSALAKGQQDHKGALETHLKDVERQKGAVREKLRTTKRRQRDVLGQIEQSDANLEEIDGDLRYTRGRLGEVERSLRSCQQLLSRTQGELTARRGLLSGRLRSSYERGTADLTCFFLSSEDSWDILARGYYLRCLLRCDCKLLRDVEAKKAQVEAQKAELALRKAQVQAFQSRLVARQKDESAERRQKAQLLSRLKNERALGEAALAELERESNEIEAQIRALAKTKGGRERQEQPWTGGFIRPVDGAVTSGFGMRMHPILNVWKMHTGVDLAASTGTPIKAAAGGTVIIAERKKGYGNTVVIDHGGGVSTLYGHCSTILVSVGQSVEQGQTIAEVGSTGLCTGPHLHFEKRINGKPVDPL
jgi:murein DD-endopeptidase MepM/ murein hydrolase activator NlpD